MATQIDRIRFKKSASLTNGDIKYVSLTQVYIHETRTSLFIDFQRKCLKEHC